MALGKIADKPFEHRCRNGTIFRAQRCDLVGGVTAYIPTDLTMSQVMEDVAQMSGYHAIVIHPELNGFAGYDCVRFNMGAVRSSK